MYAPNMWERFRGAPVVVMAAWSLASCDTPARSAAVPAPEAEQVVSAALKKLYMLSLIHICPVRAVAVLAEGRIGTALRSQRAVRAFAVLVHLLVVADGAIHLILNGVAGSHVGRGPAGMALHAGDARMTRVGQFIGADV